MSMILCGILAALLVTSSEATAERRSALVIGNGDYRNGPLRGPTHDARNMADALRESGFSVEECVDCDKREMETAIRDFGTRINRGGVGLFYVCRTWDGSGRSQLSDSNRCAHPSRGRDTL